MFHVTQPTNDPHALAFLRAKLDDLEARGLRRRTPEPEHGPSFCSNDYLGLASRLVSIDRAVEAPSDRTGGTISSVRAGAAQVIAEREEHAALKLTSAGADAARVIAGERERERERGEREEREERAALEFAGAGAARVAEREDAALELSSAGAGAARVIAGERGEREEHAALEISSTGAGAARLIAGEREEHAALERAFAAWLEVPSCLAFTSGYAANVGAISALVSPEDLVVSDVLNHASIIDGIRLSRARVVVTPHNDTAAIERALATRTEARAWVMVESYFSMDADGPDLGRLRALCDEHGAALYVDEAHALGVLGPGGRGRCAEAGIAADVLIGTLGKAFGSQGAIVAGSSILREWLWNRARSFVYSTGLSPSAAAAARLALEHTLRHPEARENVLTIAALLRRGLATISRRANVQVLGFGHVVPIVVGATERTLQIERALAQQGYRIPAIRPPTVPEGTARLRITLTSRHSTLDVDHLLTALARSLTLA